ncbi:MAG: isopentenyl-diphosphate Delta-isomerase [Parcubacteria group bacterium]|jgi:isopentenyl-diphosphate delta-isomerase
MNGRVILVDREDKKIGSEDKLKAHRSGKMHRAFSVLVFNSRREMLLQKRAKGKYHSGGLWTNACCSHPRPGERILSAAKRRLGEEMGFTCALKKAFSFHYCAKLDNGMTENEYDHVLRGEFNGDPVPNPDEAEDWKWMNWRELKKDISRNPRRYTYWFKIVVEKLDGSKK